MFFVQACIRALKKMEKFHRSPEAKCVTAKDKANEISGAIKALERIGHDVDAEACSMVAFRYIGDSLTFWWD